MIHTAAIEPEYSAEEREEIDRLDYFLSELRSYRDRGVIPAEAYAAVEAEKAPRRADVERFALASGAIKRAREAGQVNLLDALFFAEKARTFAPEKIQGWMLSSKILLRLGRLDEVIAVCKEGAGWGHDSLLKTAHELQMQKDREREVAEFKQAKTQVSQALAREDYEAAFAACETALRGDPHDAAMLETAVQSLVELDRLKEAEAYCASLQKLRPGVARKWFGRIRSARNSKQAVEAKQAEAPVKLDYDEVGDAFEEASPKAKSKANAPSTRWSAIAGEFLEDHWQKLLLSLAVLLIVVSSTVGAAIILGESFWTAEGKCLLATAYTLVFAGFGLGLTRWGAERAGRIMRLTTLILLPVNFALVGELPGLGKSSWGSLVVLMVDSAAMVALTWRLCGALGVSGGRGTALTLTVLGLANALTPRSSEFNWAFSTFLGASVVFAGSGEWVAGWVSRRRDSDKLADSDAPYFALGLLAFYFACAVGRIGVYILHLPPALFALPVMLAAWAAVRVSEALSDAGRLPRPAAMIRLSGYSLSALAFALTMAAPNVNDLRYSVSTLATSLVGLALYGQALVKERRDAYLYAGFAALLLAYFGALTLLKDILLPLDLRVGHALGYAGRLPIPFRSLNGLIFNAILAVLAVEFARKWKDERLVWHCHAIGLPLSLASCVLSGFESLAAVVTLAAYTIAYGVATWLFYAPRVAYLASAAFVGSATFGFVLWGDHGPSSCSLFLASVSGILWLVCFILRTQNVPMGYREPFIQTSQIVATTALVFAVWSVWNSPSLNSVGAIWALTCLYLLIAFELPREWIAYGAAGCGALASIVTIQLTSARFGWSISTVGLALCSAGLGVVYQAIGRVLVNRGRARIYPVALFHVGLVLCGLAGWLIGKRGYEIYPILSTIDLAGFSAIFLLIALSLVVASISSEVLAYPAVVCGAMGFVSAAMAVGSWRGWPPSVIGFSLSCGGVGLFLVGLGDRIRNATTQFRVLYRRPILASVFLSVAAAWASGCWAWQDAPSLSIVLACTAITLAIAVRQIPERPMPDLALITGLASWLVGWNALGYWTTNALLRDGLLILGFCIFILVGAELAKKRSRRSPALDVFAASMPDVVAVVACVGLAMGTVGLWTGDFRMLTADLTLASIVFLWHSRFRDETGFAHLGLLLGWFASGSAACWKMGFRDPGILQGWLAMISAIYSSVLVSLRALGPRKWSQSETDAIPAVGAITAVTAILIVISASDATLDSYPFTLSALLLLIPTLAFSAMLSRKSWNVYGAVVAGVSASYLTLFELGRYTSGPISTLGVLASLLSIVCWTIDRSIVQWGTVDSSVLFGKPLRYSSAALAVIALVPDYGASWALLLASLPFILLIKSFPSSGWLYPGIGSLLASAFFAVNTRWGHAWLAPLSVLLAYGSWNLGLTLWRAKQALCRGLGLPDHLKLEQPAYHAAIGLGLAALCIRLDAVWRLQEPWSSSPWLIAVVGLLSLLMVKPYPHRGWVDAFVLLLSLSTIPTLHSSLATPMSWALLGMILALLWKAFERASAFVEKPVCQGLGVAFDRFDPVAHMWSFGFLAIAALPMAARVFTSVADSTFGFPSQFGTPASLEWVEGFLAILLFGANIEWTFRSLNESKRISVHATTTLLLWWLAAANTTLVHRWTSLVIEDPFLVPAATIIQAFVCVLIARWKQDRLLNWYGAGLCLAAIVLTGGKFGIPSVVTMALASILLCQTAVALRNRALAAIGSAVWIAALLYASETVARRFGWYAFPANASMAAVGLTVAALGLVVSAGWARRRDNGLEHEPEVFAAAALGLASLGVVLTSIHGMYAREALVSVGVMAAVASLCMILASRWTSLAMAFAAQAATLLAYCAFRSGFELPTAGDSTVILLLAGIDLGIAEVAGKARRLFTLPALIVGLALPVVSVALSLRNGPIGELPLFALFASGTFYAAACGRLRWKSLGYASAVLYNAALWVLWSRLGWKMVDQPQFYLVPVGFSTILFAEANRRELGRSNVNAIRGIGLTLIYLSLAFPVWQTHSLGAWVGILIASLLGVFAGIALHSQAFLWLGLAGFLLDVVYQLGRIGMEHALAKWAIMTCVGLALFVFVALSEKKRLVGTIRDYVNLVRQWE